MSRPARATDLSGQGAAICGGRWNHVNVPALYTGKTPSVCALETLVHTTSSLPDPVPLVLITLDLPDDPELYMEYQSSGLPDGWNALPADEASKSLGTEFLNKKAKLGLVVPSAVMPLDQNIILNPRHSAMDKVTIVEQHEYQHDPRLFSLLAIRK